MKSKYCPVFLSLVLAMVSCQQKELETPAPRVSQELVFTAGLADASETRTHFQREGDVLKTVWDANESISIFYGGASTNGGSKFTSTNDQPTEEASFSGVLDAFTGMNEGGQSLSFWSIYPYASDNAYDGDETVTLTLPTVQTAVEENISMNTYPMVAKTSGLSLSFYNVGTLLRVCVSSPDITGIVFRGNNGEVVSGRVSVTMDSDGRPVWSRIAGQGKTYVTLKAPEGDTFEVGKYYYIAFLPQTFSNGWSLSFQKAGSAENPGSFGFYKKTDSAIFERAKSKNASNRDQGINFSSFVDMGNGLKIATVNIGGDSPEDAGERFAWGETTTKASYSWNNYFWGTSSSALTKYNATDGKTVLEPEDDAATIICGEGWHTPTVVEWQSLQTNSTATFNSDGTVTLTSKADNSKSITLYTRTDGSTYTFYWTSSLTNPIQYARALRIGNDNTISSWYADTRFNGNYIRAIYSTPVHVAALTLNKQELKLAVGQSETLTATIEPSDVTNKTIRWESSNPVVATVDENGTVTAIAEGNATISVTTVDGGLTATCEVTVDAHGWVEMGEGILWATMNLGATSETDPGDYYAWGETETYYETRDPLSWKTGKESGYSWSSYTKFMPVAGQGFSKYVRNSDEGILDGRTVLEAVDDAASVKWQGDWRIPTDEEWRWLLQHCTWTEETVNGVAGWTIRSNETEYENNSIFLPATGKLSNTSLVDQNVGCYWTSSLSSNISDFALSWTFNGFGSTLMGRSTGFAIRPVRMPRIPVEGVQMGSTSLNLLVGDTDALSATITPTNATEQGLLWSSTNASVVTVDVAGGITAVGEGSATIIATTVDGRFSAACTVTVNAKYVKMGPNQWWATCNLGPTSSSEYSFAWGNPTHSGGYSWNNYLWGDSALSISKYQFPDGKTDACWYDSNGDFIGDGIGVLKPEDDAATAMWGSEWRIPTRSDWEWLEDNCIWLWDGGGYLVISNYGGYEGNQIYLPAGQGYWYWSSTINGYDSSKAYYMDIDEMSVYHRIGSAYRYHSYMIRPIHSPKIDVTGITLNQTALTLNVANMTEPLIATITPSNASEKHIVWASSNPSVASVSADGVVTALSSGTATITAIIDQNKRATCEVTVNPIMGTLDGHDWVDMGNGLKWATMNIGASSETDYGDYYAWGYTSSSLYYTMEGYSYTENPSILPASKDAAAANWGNNWRMPTEADFDWLLNTENCTSVLVFNYNGTSTTGCLFTSKSNGNKLFLPAAGYRSGTLDPGVYLDDPTLHDAGSSGYYWASTLSNTTGSAQCLTFGLYSYMSNHTRYSGLTVRPVSGSSN